MKLQWQFIYLLYINFCIVFSAKLNIRNTCTLETTCNKSSCVQASNYILKHINESIQPCDDFYQFACGGFLRDNVLRDDQEQISKFIEIRDLVLMQMKNALEEPLNKTEPKVFNLVKDFYKTCMDTKRMDEYGLNNVKLLLKSFGGWPVVEGKNWNETAFDWQELTYKLIEHGFPIGQFINLRVDETAKNSKKILTIEEAHLPVNRINLFHGFNNTVIGSFYKFLVDTAVLYGANRTNAMIELREALMFLMELGKITSTSIQRQNMSEFTHTCTIKHVQKMIPFINWNEYINNIIAVPQVKLSDNTTVNVANFNFLKKLDKLLKVTPKRVQANYIIAIIVTNIGYALNKDARDLDAQLYKEISKVNPPPRWMLCVTLSTENIRIGSSALYVWKYFNENIKLKVAKVMYNLHEELLHMLKKVSWMDDETKVRAIKKAENLKWYIGYPDELMDDVVLNEYYKDLNSSDEYFQFLLNVQKFNSDKSFQSLSQTVNKSSWLQYTSVQHVEAYYVLGENAILLPAGILQGGIFNSKRPKFMNYGGIGYIIGHELTHGFDYMGKQFNENRELKNLWTLQTSQGFSNKLTCFNSVYGSYVVPELNMHINNLLTQNENVADNGGIDIAYNAYQTWVKRNGREQCLPNLKYTPNQLFWISTAITWCSKETVQHLLNNIVTSHPPQSIRIFGVTTNSPKFANDFNCPLGSKMNPQHKCSFW